MFWHAFLNGHTKKHFLLQMFYRETLSLRLFCHFFRSRQKKHCLLQMYIHCFLAGNSCLPKSSCESDASIVYTQGTSKNGDGATTKPDPHTHGPKTQEDVMAEERAEKLKQEKEKEGWWGKFWKQNDECSFSTIPQSAVSVSPCLICLRLDLNVCVW